MTEPAPRHCPVGHRLLVRRPDEYPCQFRRRHTCSRGHCNAILAWRTTKADPARYAARRATAGRRFPVALGDQFGDLTIIAPEPPDRHHNRRWRCRRPCGHEQVVATSKLRRIGRHRCQTCRQLHARATAQLAAAAQITPGNVILRRRQGLSDEEIRNHPRSRRAVWIPTPTGPIQMTEAARRLGLSRQRVYQLLRLPHGETLVADRLAGRTPPRLPGGRQPRRYFIHGETLTSAEVATRLGISRTHLYVLHHRYGLAEIEARLQRPPRTTLRPCGRPPFIHVINGESLTLAAIADRLHFSIGHTRLILRREGLAGLQHRLAAGP